MKKETLKVVKAAARKLQPVPPPRKHKDKKKYHRHDKHRTVHRNDAGLFFGGRPAWAPEWLAQPESGPRRSGLFAARSPAWPVRMSSSGGMPRLARSRRPGRA